jgi:fucose 4-O-acetylase-like acetyltransferase
MTGLILLVFIAVIIAFFYTRARGKMKLPIAGKHWTGVIIVIVLVVLMLWASSQGHKP